MKMIDNRLVYAVKYLFADFSDLRFSWIYKAASRVVSKVGFVIFKGNEGFPFGGGINPVIQMEFPGYFLGFKLDRIHRVWLNFFVGFGNVFLQQTIVCIRVHFIEVGSLVSGN